jgi:hypothetical protein
LELFNHRTRTGRIIRGWHDFTGWGKTLFFEGYGLQPVHKRLKTDTALAAEGRISILLPTFSAASEVDLIKTKCLLPTYIGHI